MWTKYINFNLFCQGEKKKRVKMTKGKKKNN